MMRQNKSNPIVVWTTIVLSLAVIVALSSDLVSPQVKSAQDKKDVEEIEEARKHAVAWIAETSQYVPGWEAWEDVSVGEPTAYTGEGGIQSILVSSAIKDQKKVGYVTIEVQLGRCTVLESGLGPPPSNNLPQVRELAAEKLNTSPNNLNARLVFLEMSTYLVEFTGPDGEEITFNLLSLREFP